MQHSDSLPPLTGKSCCPNCGARSRLLKPLCGERWKGGMSGPGDPPRQMNIWKLGNPVRIFGFNRQMVKARPMKTAFTPFDRLVEQHYLGAYQIAVALVSDPLVATRVTDRVFRHLRDLAGTHGNLVLTRRMLAKIVYLESAADSLRIATA
jgi:hypothetical protein